MGVPLVGRDRELAVLLSDAWMRTGFVITGPAGIGRTRLLNEIATRARASSPAAKAGVMPSRRRRVLFLTGGLTRQPDGSVLGGVHDLRGSGPKYPSTLLIVDDAHQRGAEPSLPFLATARQQGATLVLAVNSDRGSSSGVLDLGMRLGLRRLHLAGLDDVTAGELVTSLAGFPLTPASSRRLVRLAEGNPLALVELLHAAVKQGAIGPDGSEWGLRAPIRMPERLSGESTRIDGLRESHRRVLELAAIAESIAVPFLEQLVPENDLIELEQAGLLHVHDADDHPDPEVTDGLEVSVDRPMIRELVLQGIPKLRRRALLRDLLGVSGAARPHTAMWLRVVAWRLETGVPVDEATLLDAVRYARHRQEATVVTALAEAAWRTYRSPEAATTLATVLDGSAQHEQAEAVLDDAESRHGRREAIVLCRARGLVLQNRLDAAAALVAPLDTSGGALCRAVVAYHRGEVAPSYEGCVRLMNDPDPARRAEAGLYAAGCLRRMGRPETAMRLLRDVRVEMEQEGAAADVSFGMIGDLVAIMAETAADAGQLMDAYELLAHDAGRPGAHPVAPELARRQVVRASVLVTLGRTDDALTILASIAHRADVWEISRHSARIGQGALEAIIAAEACEVSEADPSRDRRLGAATSPHSGVHAELAAAWRARFSSSDTEIAARLQNAAETAAAWRAHGDLALVVHQMGRLGVADAAEPWWDVAVEGPLLRARLDYTRALATGDVRLLAGAAANFAAVKANLYAAESFNELACLYLRFGQGKRASAASQRARQLAEQCQRANTPPLQFSNGARPLSRREREIAMLARGGLSDQTISAQLSLSIRTVQNHLYHVYQKFGISGRRALRDLAELG